MLDVRAWTTEEQVRVDRAVRGWQPEGQPVSVRIGGGIDRPAMEESASADLFILAQGEAARIGLDTLHGRSVGGASDGNLTAAAGLPTLDGLGAVGDGAHADHEWASIPALAERAALVAALLRYAPDELTQHPGELRRVGPASAVVRRSHPAGLSSAALDPPRAPSGGPATTPASGAG